MCAATQKNVKVIFWILKKKRKTRTLKHWSYIPFSLVAYVKL